MAKKSRKMKSKKELEREGITLGIELDRRHNKEDLLAELESILPEEAILPEEVRSAIKAGEIEKIISKSKEVTSDDVNWNSIEEFTEAANESGLIYNGDFIPVDVPALYDAYTSNPTEFKQTTVYKFLTQ